MLPCQLKQKNITGKSSIWTCHSFSSAHCCWHLHHSPSTLKLRISFVILLHIPMCLDNHGRLAGRPVGIRKIFYIQPQMFRQSSKCHLFPFNLLKALSCILLQDPYLGHRCSNIFFSGWCSSSIILLKSMILWWSVFISLQGCSGFFPASWWTSWSMTQTWQLKSVKANF